MTKLCIDKVEAREGGDKALARAESYASPDQPVVAPNGGYTMGYFKLKKPFDNANMIAVCTVMGGIKGPLLGVACPS